MNLVHKRTLTDVEATEEGEVRKVNFTVSTGGLDRDGDTIAPDGWDLEPYRKNPVVLWHHDSSIPPIAKSEAIDVVDGKLKAVTVFPPKGDYPFADTVFSLLKGGFVNMASVGFQPKEKEPSEKGYDYKKQELYEWSILPIGSNRDALQEAKAAGIDIEPIVKWAKEFLSKHADDQVVKALAAPAPPSVPGASKDGGDHAGAGAVSKKVEQRGDKYVVLDADGEKVLGTHDNEEDAKAQLAAIEANKGPMCPTCVKAAKDGAAPGACDRCEEMRKAAVAIDVKVGGKKKQAIDPVTGEENDLEDQRPKLVNEILAEIAAEDEKREDRWNLEDALRISLNSIAEYASDAERQGLIEQTVTQFAQLMAPLKALAEMEGLAKELFPGTVKQEGDDGAGGTVFQGFGNEAVDTGMAELHGAILDALGTPDAQERANKLKEALEAFAVVVMEAAGAAEPEPEPAPEPAPAPEPGAEGDGGTPPQFMEAVAALEKTTEDDGVRAALAALKAALAATKDGKLSAADLVNAITPAAAGEEEFEKALQDEYGVSKADLATLVGGAVRAAVASGRTQLNGRLPD